MTDVIVLTLYGKTPLNKKDCCEDDLVYYFNDFKIMIESVKITYSKIGNIIGSSIGDDFCIFIERKDGQVFKIGEFARKEIEIIDKVEHL